MVIAIHHQTSSPLPCRCLSQCPGSHPWEVIPKRKKKVRWTQNGDIKLAKTKLMREKFCENSNRFAACCNTWVFVYLWKGTKGSLYFHRRFFFLKLSKWHKNGYQKEKNHFYCIARNFRQRKILSKATVPAVRQEFNFVKRRSSLVALRSFDRRSVAFCLSSHSWIFLIPRL